MQRFPVSASEAPLCCGVSYDPEDERCARCEARQKCAYIVKGWKPYKSLAQKLMDARRVFSPSSESSFVGKYSVLHRRFFGTDPSSKSLKGNRGNKALRRAEAFCKQQGIDPAVYIAAQMAALADSQQVAKYGFQPTLLNGENAKGRYNAFVRKNCNRYGRADAYTEETVTDLLLALIKEEEERVATYYVTSHLSGMEIPWSAAIDHCQPNDYWRALEYADTDTEWQYQYRILRQNFSLRTLDDMKYLVQLEAAASLVDTLRYGLSAVITFRGEFQWSGLALLLVRLCGRQEPKGRQRLDPNVALTYGRHYTDE